jgi:hypothetical protein
MRMGKFMMLAALAASWAAGTAVHAESSNVLPAEWMPHDIVVDLHHLPKQYSCDELWYKFHGVLLQLGARPDMNILTYRCARSMGAAGYSPSVQLQFSMPHALAATDRRWSDVQVRRSKVSLQPGTPSTLDAADCELVRQINEALLPVLASEHTVSDHLACGPSSTAHKQSFNLTVDTLTPLSAARVADAAVPATP